MEERIISAGVFTNEIEQSLLKKAITEIGAAIVGPTTKGPAFIPTTVSSFAEYEEIFGTYTDESYVPHAAQEYLKNSNRLTVTRLLPEDGWTLHTGSAIQLGSIAFTSYTSGEFTGYSTDQGITHVLLPTEGVAEYSEDFYGNIDYQKFQNTTYVHDVANPSRGVLNIGGNFTSSYNPLVPNDWPASFSISMSINPDDPDYVTKIFGRSPKSTKYPVYVAYEDKSVYNEYVYQGGYPDASIQGKSLIWAAINATGSGRTGYYTGSYSEAKTPYITSQKTIGNTVIDLFRFATISHGVAANYDVKVGIRDIRLASETTDPAGYGSFTVEVRRVNTTNNPYAHYVSKDTDRVPEVLEIFRNVNLNPDSDQYIGKVIGDRYQTVTSDSIIKFNGDFANKSKYIRVEIADAVRDKIIDKTMIPFGFESLKVTLPPSNLMQRAFSPSGFPGTENLFFNVNFSAYNYMTGFTAASSQVVDGAYHKNNYFGFDYTRPENLGWLREIPAEASASSNSFYLGDMSQQSQAAFPNNTSPYTGTLTAALNAGTFTQNISIHTRKFMVPFQGGSDGTRPNLPKFIGDKTTTTNTYGFDCSGLETAGTKLYRKAFNILSNADYYDMNMLITPGIYDVLHSNVTTAARNLCVDRQDTFYVMDMHTYKYNGSDVNLQTIIDATVELDNNYAATYWPWVQINNPLNNVPLWVPPSVVVPGAISLNDRIGENWFAPAGLTRGGLSSVLKTYNTLTLANRNDLYDSRINPIANFNTQGIVVWGQKTLEADPSLLDRVNVRRMLIEVKKFIASATKYLVFEANNSATRDRFLAIVNPYLESVAQRQGLTSFKVVMDSVNNTQEMIDQGIIYGQLFLKPTKTAEFIILDFNILPTGATFPG